MSHAVFMRIATCLSLLWLAPMPALAQNYTPSEDLMYRINFGRADDVKLLLDRGANPNARNMQGDPALSIAIDRQDNEAPAMVKTLLDHGANPNIPNSSKVYPIMRAVNNGQTALVAALLARGAEYDIKNGKGQALIDLARHGVNPAVAIPIQQAMDEKKAYDDGLRSVERYQILMRFYRLHSCEYQYWNYFKSSRAEPRKDAQIDAKIEAQKTMIAYLVHQFQTYFPATKAQALETISNNAAGQVLSDMDALISNSNRAEHGIGHDKDAHKRCMKIAGPPSGT